MKKETLKEIGKYLLDISKILIALALITPVLKDNSISYVAIALVMILSLIGFYFTNKGALDE